MYYQIGNRNENDYVQLAIISMHRGDKCSGDGEARAQEGSGATRAVRPVLPFGQTVSALIAPVVTRGHTQGALLFGY